MVAGVRPLTSSAWMTAVSVSGSVPRILAGADVPSLKETEIVPESPATSTTWLLVRIWPSELRMMPEPEPGLLGAADVDLHDRRQHLLGDLLDRAVGGGPVGGVDDLRRGPGRVGGRGRSTRRGATRPRPRRHPRRPPRRRAGRSRPPTAATASGPAAGRRDGGGGPARGRAGARRTAWDRVVPVARRRDGGMLGHASWMILRRGLWRPGRTQTARRAERGPRRACGAACGLRHNRRHDRTRAPLRRRPTGPLGAETPDAEAMTYLSRTWTWAEWDDRVRRAAGGLQGAGDRPRRRGGVPRQEPPGLRRAAAWPPARSAPPTRSSTGARPATRSTTPSTTAAPGCCSSAPS